MLQGKQGDNSASSWVELIFEYSVFCESRYGYALVASNEEAEA